MQTTTTQEAQETNAANLANPANYSATYSPEDNKLRLYSVSRLDKETYAEARRVGFIWAAKQDCFVAPAWSPAREDFLLGLAGEIDDEDTSLVERAEQRADRFGDYSSNRAADATAAQTAVHAIADGIPFGQPILVGHHSERKARKDAERIEQGMRRAVRMWETADYWQRRAAGAIAHAKYKERPDVRARRIKVIEADKRKAERNRDEAAHWLAAWSKEGLTHDEAVKIAGGCGLRLARKEGDRPDFNQKPSAYDALMNTYPSLYAPRTVEEVVNAAKRSYPPTVAVWNRWIAHYDNRLAYERAMLAEGGGTASDQTAPQKGGACKCWASPSGCWSYIVKVNKVSVTVFDNWGNGGNNFTRNIPFDKLANLMTAAQVEQARKDGRLIERSDGIGFALAAPRGDDEHDTAAPAETPEAGEATAGGSESNNAETPKTEATGGMPPRCNYPGEGFAVITMEQWKKIPADYRGWVIVNPTETTGMHRVRHALGAYVLSGEKDMNRRHSYPQVFISDEKRIDPPGKMPAPAPTQPEEAQPPASAPQAAPAPAVSVRAHLDAARDALRAGVQVVSAPQLFPTPVHLAEHMARLADIRPGDRVLEPSAGTGRLLGAMGGRMFAAAGSVPCAERDQVHAVEINRHLADRLEIEFPLTKVHCTDFLQCNGDLGRFDAVLMNPPFANGDDIKHIQHAAKMLKPGGRLVAICANGPRQAAALRPMIEEAGGLWEPLPPDTFKESGTGVNTVLLSMVSP